MRTLLSVLIALGLIGGGAAYYVARSSGDVTTQFRTVAVERGDLMATISATGTLVAEEFVDVGSQVVGRIKSFGVDPSELKGRDPKDIPPDELEKMKHIDFNSVVHKGTLLALIDDAVYKAQVDQAEASLQRAMADLQQLEAKMDQTEREWQRAKVLKPQKAIADTDYDLALSNYKAAKANVGVGRAAIKQSEAALELARTNLGYTVIRSPVEGVIVDRRVNIGQTVVSNMNAASLFLIAKDLRRMQIWASVNEADIGRIHPGMPVRFKVDVAPGRIFHGKVLQVRLKATDTQTVITYPVVVETDNSDGKLLPYLTANLNFVTDQRSNILTVSNAALRWKPEWDRIAPDARSDPLLTSKADGKPSKKDNKTASNASSRHEERTLLWVADGEYVRPVEVHTGVTDGLITEVSGPKLTEGMKVVIGETRNGEAENNNTSLPFIPRMRGPKKT